MKFYDRAREFQDIQDILADSSCTLTIVYGPRDAGKSRLLEVALADQRHYSYQATKRVMSQQMPDMTAALTEMDPGIITAGPLPSVEAVFDILAEHADRAPTRPLPIVIDELPYLADADKGLLTVFQKWWRRERKKRKNLKVFFLGSRQSWMKKEAVSEEAALKTARTHNLEIRPLNYHFAASFYPGWDATDRIRAWGVWGGLPGILELIDPSRSLMENIRDLTLRPRARLYTEPDWLKFTELRSEVVYSSLVRSIAHGARSAGNVAKGIGKNSATDVKIYLDELREARVAERRPALAAKGEAQRTAMYVLTDPFLSYWYRFIDPNKSTLERGNLAPTLALLADPQEGLDKLISEQAFEDVCREFFAEAHDAGRLPKDLAYSHLGSWWKGSREESSEQLDLVAYDKRELTAVGECKWTNDPVGMSEVRDLERIVREASAELKPKAGHYRLLFAKSGFTRDVRDLAQDPAARLLIFEPADLYWQLSRSITPGRSARTSPVKRAAATPP
ncbi:MAG: ATP-binding protein [Candidatus Limnocylindria bacterium]